MTDQSLSDAPLQVARRRRVAPLLWGAVLVVVVCVAGWVTTHPADLPVDDRSAVGTTPVGEPVYAGVFTAPADFDRTLHLSGVKVHATSSVPVEITPLLCRGGSITVTSDATAFCSELVDPEGRSMGAGDQIVVEVTGSEPGQVLVYRVRVAYRDGLQRATQRAGNEVSIRVLAR